VGQRCLFFPLLEALQWTRLFSKNSYKISEKGWLILQAEICMTAEEDKRLILFCTFSDHLRCS
jgi:hypothetical protein